MRTTDMEKLEMRNPISKALIEPIEVGLAFPSAPRTAFADDGGAVLDLVHQAAAAVRDIEDRAYETERRARTIAERTVERLRVAEECIRYLEAEQRAAQTRIQMAVEALKLERSRVAAAENKLRQLEVRAGMTKLHVGAGAMIFAKRVRRKIARIVTYVKSHVFCVAPSTGNSDYGRCDIGWTEILARADAALNDMQGGGRNRHVYHKRHFSLRQVA
jgi:hypothetical protein